MNSPVEDRATAQRTEIHVGLSDRILTELAVRATRVPAPRSNADTLADLTGQVRIPQLSEFVHELLRAEQNETEAQP